MYFDIIADEYFANTDDCSQFLKKFDRDGQDNMSFPLRFRPCWKSCFRGYRDCMAACKIGYMIMIVLIEW